MLRLLAVQGTRMTEFSFLFVLSFPVQTFHHIILSCWGALLTSCLACPPGSGELVGDLDNCHIFYQCDFNPQPRSCGDMMFNTINQVTFSYKFYCACHVFFGSNLEQPKSVRSPSILQSSLSLSLSLSVAFLSVISIFCWQVCDWPNKVMQIRPECRDETKLGLILFPFYRQR